MKVLLTKPFMETDIEYIKDRIPSEIELVTPKSYSEDDIIEAAQNIDVLFGGVITDRLLTAANSLKFIQIPWTGVDNLDFGLLKKHSITICNSHSNAGIVAEHAISLMMAAAKKITYHDALMREGDWNRILPGKENAISPFSKQISKATVAIIGFGSIGKKIQKYLSGFDCQFLIFNRSIRKKDEDERNVHYFLIDDSSEHLKKADFVFIAVPLTEETKGFINAKFFEGMNNTSVLINISRGEVINEADLFNALQSKQIGSAGIDTWFNYPTKDSPATLPSKSFDFHKLPNLVLSPHRAGYVDKGFPHLDDAIENLKRLSENRDLINVISLKNKY